MKFISIGRVWNWLTGSKWYPFAHILNAKTNYTTEYQLNAVLQSPAVLKVFALQCDLFSMGKVTVETKEGEPIDDDPFLNLIRNPNPFTGTESQFLWDFMFFNMIGTSYCYVNSRVVDDRLNKMYFLEPHKIRWPESFRQSKDKLIFSEADLKALKKTEITYRYDDGSTIQFPFDRLVISHDLTNSVGNFYAGPSRLDALYKIISNSEHVLDSQNINIRYTSKFLVGADNRPGSIPAMGQEEKDDIIDNIDHNVKNVYPLRSKPAISRFVSDLGALQLPEEYKHQYFLIGSMYGIPADVLEAYANSSTYENQEKARAAHVYYCLEPKGNQWMDSYETHFKYKEQGKNIKITWKDSPFMQVFAKERAETKKVEVEVLNSLLTAGVKIEQINKYLGTEFEIEEPEELPETGSEAGPEGSGEGEEGEVEATPPAANNTQMRRIV